MNKQSARKLISVLLVFVIVLSLSGGIAAKAAPGVYVSSDFASEFANPPTESRIKVRTWWPNGNASEANIRKEVRQIAEAGFGCIELICIPESWESSGNTDAQAAQYSWGTDAWNDAVMIMLDEAETQGILVDVTIGPRWPAALPGLDPTSDEAQRKLIHSSITGTVADTTVHEYALPDRPNKSASVAVANPEFVALVGAKYTSLTTSVTSATAATRTAVIDESTLFVVPKSNIDFNGNTFTASVPSSGDYIFFAFWAVGIGQTAGGTVPSSYVINHFNTTGTKAVIDEWERVFNKYPGMRQFFKTHGGNFFIDSLEMTSADIYWSNDMAEYFLNNKGYDILKYLPLIMRKGSTNETFSLNASSQITATSGSTTIAAGANYTFGESVTTTGNANAGTEVRQDFMYNLSDMFNKNHVLQFQKWSETLNMNLRYQAQNTGGSGWNDALESQAYVGVPEGETLGMNSHPDAFRSLAGASNMSDNTHLISVELGADSSALFKMRWQRLIENVNRVISSGANQMVLHGFSTRAQFKNTFTRWPGWMPFDSPAFAEMWNEAQPSWDYMRNFTDYVSRLQTAMQYGVSRVDFAVYRYGTTIGGSNSDVQTLFRTAAANDVWKNPLTNIGYTYNYLSPGTFKLPNAKVVNGVLNPEYAGYKALIIKDVQAMPLAYAQSILQFAKDGLPIILVGLTPDTGTSTNADWSYLTNSDAAVKAVFTELKTMPKVKVAGSETDILNALTELGIKPNASYPSNNLSSVRRYSSDMDLYYLFNRSTAQDTGTTQTVDTLYHDPSKVITTTVTLRGIGKPYSLDPMTGEIEPILDYTDNSDGTISIPVTILDCEAKLIAITAIESFFGSFPSLAITSNSAGGKLVYDSGKVAFRATGNATYDVAVNGKYNSGSVSSVAAPVTLNDGWTLEVESWRPGAKALLARTDADFDPREIAKVPMGPYSVSLGEWATLSSELANISGRGLYTKTFTLGGDFTGAYLSLGKTYDNILEVTINGQVLPPADQFNKVFDLGSYVKSGSNTITVLTGTTLYKANVAAGGWARTTTWINNTYANLYGLYGDVTVTPYVDVAVYDSNAVQVDIRADAADVVVNNKASYTVSLDNTKGVGIVELSFTFDGYALDKDSITVTPLNGFTQGIYPDLAFQYLGSGIWKGTVKYMYLPSGGGYVKADGPLDILKISGTAIDIGSATVTITGFSVSGNNGTGVGPMLSQIRIADATATIGSKPAVYSKYDLNKDGSIDETDLLYLVYFYQWNDRDVGWDTADLYGIFAKDCDFQINGKVDLADMIELTANYGIYDPYA